MKKIVHLVTHDKFTANYINFMKLMLTNYQHVFIVHKNSASNEVSIDGNLVDEEHVIRYESGLWLAFSLEIKRILKDADKIIVSGIWGFERQLYFWPKWAFSKMYFHYWGGDFYGLRNEISKYDIRTRIYRHMKYSCMKRTYGAMFLIDGEYDKFRTITGIEKEHVYTARMLRNPLKQFDYAIYRDTLQELPLKIVIGNSATKENCHEEVLKKLEHLKNEDIAIYCPLSYGDSTYADYITDVGTGIFGDKFHAITQWMSLEEYYSFLSKCDVGIFNSNRQQGMGNINAMFSFGKKVYLRKNTSLIDRYHKQGYVFFCVDDIENSDFDTIRHFNDREHNTRIADEWNSTYMDETYKMWDRILSE